MDDSGAPGVSTPEHWSDVGPLSGRLQLVEQQVQAVQVGWGLGSSGCPRYGTYLWWDYVVLKDGMLGIWTDDGRPRRGI